MADSSVMARSPGWLTRLKADITTDFLKRNDGKIVWIRDDWLSMRGISAQSNPELYDFAEHVAAVKERARAEGAVFTE